MIETLKAIKKYQKKPDGIFGSFMTRPVSHICAFFCMKLGFSPNLVSFISFIFCSVTVVILFLKSDSYPYILFAAAMWWLGAILDAADGDLARYQQKVTLFGGWFDSFLDRIKEFVIFAIIGYIAFKQYNNEIYLLLGFLSIFTNVMSGWVSDTKKLFIKERTPEVKIGKNFTLGMVDTRDFVIILSLLANDMRIAILTYGTLFLFVLIAQIVLFFKKY